MNSEQLKYFELTYQERNYSAAARMVPVSPQGLTKAIRALEKELGVTLFEPDSNGMPQPTPYAQELYEFTEARAAICALCGRLSIAFAARSSMSFAWDARLA